jgi:hypothetical protein
MEPNEKAYSIDIDFSGKFLKPKSGIPLKDRTNSVFSAIDNEQLESCFIDWANSVTDLSKGQLIEIAYVHEQASQMWKEPKPD